MAFQRSGFVGFIGLDETSLEMVASLIHSGYKVQAFEKDEALMEKFSNLGGITCTSPHDVGKDVTALIVLISHVDQINDVIFGQQCALKGLQKEAVFILRTNILLSHIQNIEKRLKEDGILTYLVDAYVTRGTSEVLNGRIMITSSGTSEAIAKARPILSAMCEKLYIFEGEVGAGRKIKMVNELLEGIHLIASAEAISLGAQVATHPWIVYDIISNAAGNSWIFKNHVPMLLRGDAKPHSLNILVQELGIILDMAKLLTFPLPLLAAAHQQLVFGSTYATGDDNDVTLLKVWETVHRVNIQDAANAEPYSPEQLACQITSKSAAVNRIGFIGLGAMGFGMATHLLKSNFCVIGYDVIPHYIPMERVDLCLREKWIDSITILCLQSCSNFFIFMQYTTDLEFE